MYKELKLYDQDTGFKRKKYQIFLIDNCSTILYADTVLSTLTVAALKSIIKVSQYCLHTHVCTTPGLGQADGLHVRIMGKVITKYT